MYTTGNTWSRNVCASSIKVNPIDWEIIPFLQSATIHSFIQQVFAECILSSKHIFKGCEQDCQGSCSYGTQIPEKENGQ